MSLILEDLGKEVAVQAAGVAIGKVIDAFTENHPGVANGVALGKETLKQALALFPDEELYAYLSSDDAEAAEISFRLAKIAKFGR